MREPNRTTEPACPECHGIPFERWECPWCGLEPLNLPDADEAMREWDTGVRTAA